MITPAEIQNQAFTRGVRGYKEDEVDAFLDRIIVDLDALIRENEVLKEQLSQVQQENARFRESEGAIYRTLDSAKTLMAEISASAEKRAEIVLKNAELDADRIRREARESVEKLTEEASVLSRRWELFSARFRDLLETELSRFDSVAATLMAEESGGGGARRREKDGARGGGGSSVDRILADRATIGSGSTTRKF